MEVSGLENFMEKKICWELKDTWDLKRQGDSMEDIPGGRSSVSKGTRARTFLYFEDESISVCLKH